VFLPADGSQVMQLLLPPAGTWASWYVPFGQSARVLAYSLNSRFRQDFVLHRDRPARSTPSRCGQRVRRVSPVVRMPEPARRSRSAPDARGHRRRAHASPSRGRRGGRVNWPAIGVVGPSLTQMLVLAVAAEAPTHGFQIAALTDPGGELGQVWTVRRALVYHALDELIRVGLLEPVRTEPGEHNVPRTIVRASKSGRRLIDTWLQAPVPHVRDVRSALLLKLALHARRGSSPATLLHRQAEQVQTVVAELEARLADADAKGFARTLGRWRLQQARSVLEFVRDELAASTAGA
jgi:DNA-binding PadR family transcriptional regulator